VAPFAAPDNTLTIGAVIALTSNANLYGQGQRLGLELARRWSEAFPLPAGNPPRRPLKLQLEDGGSDVATAIAAFNLLIKQGSLALIGPFISRVSAQSSVMAPLSIV
jgi:branched-chain amino acid transport system substrate-binding protein